MQGDAIFQLGKRPRRPCMFISYFLRKFFHGLPLGWRVSFIFVLNFTSVAEVRLMVGTLVISRFTIVSYIPGLHLDNLYLLKQPRLASLLTNIENHFSWNLK